MDKIFQDKRLFAIHGIAPLLAPAKITWYGPEKGDAKALNGHPDGWKNFIEQMSYQFKLFDKEKWNYNRKDLE